MIKNTNMSLDLLSTTKSPMINKKWYTLMEIILVISVISVFVFIMKPFFQSNQKDFFYIESCSNKIYGDMNNFMYDWATSKGIYKGNTKIFPNQYIINIKDSNTIALEYQESNGQTGTYLTNYLTCLKDFYCRNN